MKKYLLTFLAGLITGMIIITYITASDILAKNVESPAKENVICEITPAKKESFKPEEEAEELVAPKITSMHIDAPYIYQMDKYPNGCESVSAVMALQYHGIDIDVDKFIDEYLPMGPRPDVGGIGPDPDKVYCGDPRSVYGWGCYSSVIADIFKSCGYSFEHSYTDTLEELCAKYIDKGTPVIVWATVNMEDSEGNNAYWRTEEGKEVSYNRRLHCLLLVGYDEEYYYFNDPMVAKSVPYVREACEKAFKILGNQSIAIVG